MKRMLEPFIQKDLPHKVVLLSGPRQSGKTTLSRHLKENYLYFNYDLAEHRVLLAEKSWRKDVDLLILDELHKMPNWKAWIKGIYDTQGLTPPLLVTGSARMDTYRKVGDSLAGRYFSYRMHPFTLKELLGHLPKEEAFKRLLVLGGFPEPFLQGEEGFYRRWKKTHLDIILRQDLLDLEQVRDIKSIETLVELLRSRVGSPISYSSLARDLEKDPKTIKKWISILENLYVIFSVHPYHKNIARSILKEPKYYFFDTGQVKGNQGIQLENLTACALKREADFLEDTTGIPAQIYYVRTKEGLEVDFLMTLNEIPSHLIEVKWADSTPSKALMHFFKHWPQIKALQLLGELEMEKQYPNGIGVYRASDWLSHLDLQAGVFY